MYKRKFIIPIGNITREQAEKVIRELMSKYHEDVEWFDTPTIKRKDRRKKFERILNERL